MFLQLTHLQFDAHRIAARTFVKDCYSLRKLFPAEEKFAMMQQIRRVALSVYPNNSEGFSSKSEAARKRFFKMTPRSVIEVDAALDVAGDLGYCKKEDIINTGQNLTRCFPMLSKLSKH